VALTSMILGATAAARADAMRAREDFISIASHEMRTPLTALQLQIHRLRRLLIRGTTAVADPAELTRAMDLAERQVTRMTGLTEVLLDLTRLRGGDLRLDRQRMDLVGLLRECAQAVDGARISKSEATSRSAFDIRAPDEILGDWDRTRLQQVLENLLGNAVKYGGSETITVTATATAKTASVEIEDHGPGIATIDQKRIFQRFERAVSADTSPGLGLGLHISRQILEAHGGTIRLSSRPGKGATFSVALPLARLRNETPR
jgi:signal transduction histidine kinase